MTTPATLVRVSGALAEAEPLASASLYELVRVGERGLLGEVIRIAGERTTVQVYEETSRAARGRTGHPHRRVAHRAARSWTAGIGAGRRGPTAGPRRRRDGRLHSCRRDGGDARPGRPMDVQSDRTARRRGERRRRARHGGGAAPDRAPRPGAAGRHRNARLDLRGLVRRQEAVGRLADGTPLSLSQRGRCASHARSSGVAARRPVRDRAAGVRLSVPGRGGRQRRGAGRIRHRQDGHRTVARQVRRGGRGGLRRLRRARQRDGRRAGGVPPARGPAHRATG